VIGGIGLSPGPDGAELGYWLARALGRGLAGEAARAMLHLARQLGHNRLVAHHFLDNPASGRVLARLGFRPTGASERFSLARGGKSPAVTLRLRLDNALEDDPDDGMAPRKAA
jgi:RimJ/RimL family protein N-acetyltransferase